MSLLAQSRRPIAGSTWSPAAPNSFPRHVTRVKGSRSRYTVFYRRVLQDGSLGVPMETGQEGWVEWAQETMAVALSSDVGDNSLLLTVNRKLHAARMALKTIIRETSDNVSLERAERAFAATRMA